MVIKTNFSYNTFVLQLFLKLQVLSWELNASVLIQGDTDAIDLKYPAVTICPKVSTKYGIAERLGNYIDPNNLPDKALSLKKEIFKYVLDKKLSYMNSYADQGRGKSQNFRNIVVVLRVFAAAGSSSVHYLICLIKIIKRLMSFCIARSHTKPKSFKVC